MNTVGSQSVCLEKDGWPITKSATGDAPDREEGAGSGEGAEGLEGVGVTGQW